MIIICFIPKTFVEKISVQSEKVNK